MIYLRNKLKITWKLSDFYKPSKEIINNLNKYFSQINKFKFIVVDFLCSSDAALKLSKELIGPIGFTVYGSPIKDYTGEEKNERYKTLTNTQLFYKWFKDEEIKNEKLEDKFICTNCVDNITIYNNLFFYGSCNNKVLAGDLREIVPFVKTNPIVCNEKKCLYKNTKVNLKKCHIIKDVCLENPMFYIKWRLLNNCNYHCSYCIRKDLGVETFPGFKELLNRADNFNKMKIPFRLELIGGEVTLLDLKCLLSRITTENLKAVYISTNLYRDVNYFEELYKYLHSRNIELALSCSLHEEECDENKFIEKIKQLSNIVDRVYLECVSTDKNENTINKILQLENVKISLDYLRDRSDNVIAKKRFEVKNKKLDIECNEEKIHHSELSGFVSTGCKCKSNGLYIDVDGSIYRRSCKQKQLISNIKEYDFNIKEDIIDCPNSVCNFSSNVEVYNK